MTVLLSHSLVVYYQWVVFTRELVVSHTRYRRPTTCRPFQLPVDGALDVCYLPGEVVCNPHGAGSSTLHRDGKLELHRVVETNELGGAVDSVDAVHSCHHHPVGLAGTEGTDDDRRLTRLETSHWVSLKCEV